MAETRPQSTSRLEKSAKRRQMIVETAAGLFIEKGFHQTGMRDIAGKAGISLSNLYNHFKGKNETSAELVLGLIERSGQNAVSRDVSTRKQLRQSMLAFVERAVGTELKQG